VRGDLEEAEGVVGAAGAAEDEGGVEPLEESEEEVEETLFLGVQDESPGFYPVELEF